MDFPVDNFDLSRYIVQKNGQVSYRYKLYAVSNHYGVMGGGHYTAFAQVSRTSVAEGSSRFLIVSYIHDIFLSHW